MNPLAAERLALLGPSFRCVRSMLPAAALRGEDPTFMLSAPVGAPVL